MKKYNSKFKKIIFLFSIGISSLIYSQNEEIQLWKTIPGSIESLDYKEGFTNDNEGIIKGFDKVSQPTITVFLANPEKLKGTSVIICPGGGYEHLAINKEGYKVAKWFNSIGISAFVLKYRLPSDFIMKDKSIGPLQDAQEAVRMIRRNAKKWHLETSKIGIMGFSAGGHLAATLSTHYNDKVYESIDNISARPDFSILIYPVISMEDAITHKGSKENLLGKNASSKMIEKYSNDKQVDYNTPKTFLVHATDDKTVPIENSINYYLALKNYLVPTEMHVYESGGHGFGLGTQGTNSTWPKSCKKWLETNGFINTP